MGTTRYITRRRKGQDIQVDAQLARYRKYRAEKYIKETKQRLGRPKLAPIEPEDNKYTGALAHNFFGDVDD